MYIYTVCTMNGIGKYISCICILYDEKSVDATYWRYHTIAYERNV